MGIYSSLESKWYSAIETINKIIPITKVTDKIDEKVPSFLVFIAIILILLLLFIIPIFLSFEQTNTLEVTVTSTIGLPINNAQIEILDNGNEIKEYFTGADGKVKISVLGEEFVVTVSKTNYASIVKEATLGDKLNFRLSGSKSDIYTETYSTILVNDEEGAFIESSIIDISCDGITSTLSPLNSSFYFKRDDCLITQITATAPGYDPQSITLAKTTERKSITLTRVIREGTLLIHTKNFGLIEPNVEITITNIDGKSKTVFTDSGGETSTKLAAGMYTYLANSRGEIIEGEIEIIENDIE
ncbi:MAG: hypothetical protein HN878_01115, partial [Candidatus Diapherotrites archaeon]|nr:hypothetical protein [Candidatus Diapherotrites archaeon]